ncbi:hypothetical protein ABT369_19540 [Dactylosporangium sp. NPDC000244]|uniref:hypothetical protein n=1 Tax=Dactylosporangium sp. NPDC000244 TaxID=3154365 RepID=UPI003329D167
MTTATPPADPAGCLATPAPAPCYWRQRAEQAEAELAALALERQQIRQRLHHGVAAGNLDPDVVDEILTALGMPPLRRFWTVRLQLAVTVIVPAHDADGADDAAREAIDSILNTVEAVDSYSDFDITGAGPATPGDLADEQREEHP